MAKFISYRSVKDLFDMKKGDDDIKALINRIPLFLLHRCRLLNFNRDFKTFKEVVRKFPMFLDFMMSRYISEDKARESVLYYIPKSRSDIWSEYAIYYDQIFPYDFIASIFTQSNGLHEIYFTKNNETDVFNLYFENLKDLKLGTDRFSPTDIYIGSFIEEHMHRAGRNEYTIPKRLEPVKFEVKISDFNRNCCEDPVKCIKCWLYLSASVLILNEGIESIDPEIKRMFVYNGEDGYILYILEEHERSREIATALVYKNYEIDVQNIKPELDLLIDLIDFPFPFRIAVEHLRPELKFIEYNSYTRLPYSINNDTKKICVPIEPFEFYKKQEKDMPSVFDFLNGLEVIKNQMS